VLTRLLEQAMSNSIATPRGDTAAAVGAAAAAAAGAGVQD
jgi:hypothetical protein